MSKIAIIILSDPRNGGEDAMGKVFNGLAAAYDYKQSGDQVEVLFQGAGTRWPAELQKINHPANDLFKAVEDTIKGVSMACAAAFGAEPSGLDLIKGNQIPETPGLPSLAQLTRDGFNIITF